MSTTPPSRSGLKNLLHAVVLVGCVPLVFYAGFALFSRTTAPGPEPVPPIIKKATEYGAPILENIIPPSGPAPGDAWVLELDRLKSQLEAAGSTIPATETQELQAQLERLRSHCVEWRSHVPVKVTPETPLGQRVVRLAQAIDKLRQPKPNPALPFDWQAKFQVAEQSRVSDQKARIEQQYETDAQSRLTEHRNALSKLLRENRHLEDEVQRLQDAIAAIRHQAKKQVEKHARQMAYERDKAEIERLLVPFTSPAYTQLGTSLQDWKKTTEAQPLSYRAIERLGAMQADIAGLRTFAEIGGYPQLANPTAARPLGAFPANYENTLNDPAKLELIKKAQRLLKEHSQYLIESGKLLP